jgi:hypothetical protein
MRVTIKKILILLILIFTGLASAQPEFSKISSMPGAFSRMGFGARGIGMGNALSAVTEGNLVSYYNPAVSVFQEDNSFQTSYSFLSLDRSLNFLNFTRRFDFYSSSDTSVDKKPRSSAGLSIGIINSGVSGIDGRDNQGFKTGELSTSENQFFLGFSNRFSEKLSIGVSVKIFYYKLYEEVSSTGVGLDAGLLYRINNNFNLGFVIADINSKYKWDTAPVYEQQGAITENKFPMLRKLGVRYKNDDYKLIAALEIENSNAESNIIRLGLEYNLIETFFIRGGIDQFNLSNSDYPVKPSAGFSYTREFGDINIGIDYAFMLEQYSAYDRHIVGVNVTF